MLQMTLRVNRLERVLALVGGLELLAMSPPAALAAGRRFEVYMEDDYYRPEVVYVEAGDAIAFVNKGKQMHRPTLIDHEDVLDQEFVKPGQTFSLVVPAALAPRGLSARRQHPFRHEGQDRRSGGHAPTSAPPPQGARGRLARDRA
jgi:plastocyanin